jgi:hypothetical protein
VLSTDRHILQGTVDIADLSWNDESSTLRGIAVSPKGRKYTLSVYCPPGYQAERASVDNQPTDLCKQGDELLRLCFTPAGDRTSWQISFRKTEKGRTREPDVSRISTLPERKADRRPVPLVELLPTGHEECHDSEGWLSVENDDMRILAPCIVSYDLRGDFKRLKGAVRSRARRVDTSVSFEVLADGQKAADGKMLAGQAVQIDVDVTGKRGLKLIGHALTGSDSDAWMIWEDLTLE